MRTGSFFLEGVPGTFPGYTTGSLWNGWATPLFSRDTSLAIALALRQADSGADEAMDLTYDREADAFVLHDPFAPDEATVWRAQNHTEAPEALYPIGTHEWTWEEVTGLH